MTINELLPEISLENERVEFKARLETGIDKRGDDNELKWLREISAFANSQGGTIYVGVNDRTHEIESLSHEEIDKTIKALYDGIESRVEPTITPKIDAIEIPGTNPPRYILAISVDHSRILPVYVHVNGVPACYLRQFGRAKIATPEQIASMVLNSENVSFDSMPTNLSYEKKAFQEMLRRFREQTGREEPSKDELELAGFMDENGRLSKGATLFMDGCHDEITTIKVNKFPGLNPGSSDLLSERVFQGNLPSVIDRTYDFVETISTDGYSKLSHGRKVLKAFPPRSLMEGIANAVAHRNYFLQGTFIEVNLYVDRMEIVSPGALLGGKSFYRNKDILSIHPKHRNPVIAKTLMMLRYIEAKGTGFDKIAEEYESCDAGHKPYVSCDSDSFTLVLPDLSYEAGVIDQGNPYPVIHLPAMIVSDYDEKILSCCYFQPRSLTEIASYLGIAPSTYLRTKILEGLVSAGYLSSFKSGKAMKYVVVKSKLDRIYALR